MPQAASSQLPRSANACDTCRRRKVKCSGTQPCQNCIRQGLHCTFGSPGRRGYSEAYVQQLFEKIKQSEEQLKKLERPRATSQTNESDSTGSRQSSSPRITAIEEPQNEVVARDNQHCVALTPASGLASGPAFESRVKSIMREHASNQESVGNSGAGSIPVHERAANNLYEEQRSCMDLLSGVPAPALLSKADSLRLFDVFISLMGINQHFLDPRAFTDSIDLLYQTESTQNAQMRTIWFTQYLLVMGMGMLIASPSEEADNPPGNAYFAEAMRRLPPLHQLASDGVIAVETLCLTSLYLQWCDCKYDAYLYIGSAVRLAVALGCALPHNEQQGVSSEICHRSRVWWTAYMLDRRLSAALGLPIGVDERHIRANLPTPSAGFQSPLPLTINIRIARVTGDIMNSFYGSSTITQEDLVKKMQNILQSLYEIGRCIPPDLALDFENIHCAVSRTSASLYLMLFQAIILCLRPIILQCVKEKVQLPQENQPEAAISPVISRLCLSCREAASKSIWILSALKKNKSIALFGYFDLDATFSVAFISVMMGFIEGNDAQNPPEGLSEAAEVLQYLSKAGNRAAQRRLHELKQFCSYVWCPLQLAGDWQWLTDGQMGSSEPANLNLAANHGSPNGIFQPDTSNENEDYVASTVEANVYNAWLPTTSEQSSTFFDFDSFSDFSVDPSREMGNIYSSYNDPNLPLTGIDDTDWAEVGKLFHLRGL